MFVELLEALATAIVHLIRAIIGALFVVFWDHFLAVIGWYVGWPICRSISFGRYPPIGAKEPLINSLHVSA